MAISFAMYETVEFRLPNLNFGGHTPSVAQQLVRAGKGRWAWCLGGSFAFVPLDYELKMNERFLRETPRGGFDVVDDT